MAWEIFRAATARPAISLTPRALRTIEAGTEDRGAERLPPALVLVGVASGRPDRYRVGRPAGLDSRVDHGRLVDECCCSRGAEALPGAGEDHSTAVACRSEECHTAGRNGGAGGNIGHALVKMGKPREGLTHSDRAVRLRVRMQIQAGCAELTRSGGGPRRGPCATVTRWRRRETKKCLMR